MTNEEVEGAATHFATGKHICCIPPVRGDSGHTSRRGTGNQGLHESVRPRRLWHRG